MAVCARSKVSMTPASAVACDARIPDSSPRVAARRLSRLSSSSGGGAPGVLDERLTLERTNKKRNRAPPYGAADVAAASAIYMAAAFAASITSCESVARKTAEAPTE
eukprot:scaffold1504_cov34-Tisochrysis_lutea.AAC.2